MPSLKLKLETTTGILSPGGVAPEIPRGPFDATLQFLTNNVAALLPNGHPIALKLYSLTDTVIPLATFNVWTAVPGFLSYTATINPSATDLGYMPAGTLYGRLSYGTPNVNTPLFHVVFGGSGEVVGAPIVPIIITQPSGPVDTVQDIGTFGGRVVVDQVEGFWRVKAPCQLLGLQLNAQDAPVGADLLVDVVKGGVAQTKIATLTAGAKTQETIFGAPLVLATGDSIQFKPTQVGSTKAGTNLTVKAVLKFL
jgi:hypothetical protein